MEVVIRLGNLVVSEGELSRDFGVVFPLGEMHFLFLPITVLRQLVLY